MILSLIEPLKNKPKMFFFQACRGKEDDQNARRVLADDKALDKN